MTTQVPDEGGFQELLAAAVASGPPPQGERGPQPDRLTVTMSAHHQDPTMQPIGGNFVMQRLCTTKEQPYTRRLRVSNSEPLDLAWLGYGHVGFIILDNHTGRHHSHLPTKEQRADEERRVVHVGIAPQVDSLVIRPNSLTAFELPQDEQGMCPQLTLWCEHGVADVTLYAFPR